MIKDNLSKVQEHIASICNRLGCDPNDITLIGVTKFAEMAQIKEAVEAGLKHIGENKVQEAQKKFPELQESGLDVTRHMIGHLQTNKVKGALDSFDLIQSVDSLKLAHEINKQAEKSQKKIDILIQVNTSGEEQKFGIASSYLMGLIEKIQSFKHIHISGLMTIAPLTDDTVVVSSCFKKLRVLKEKAEIRFEKQDNVQMKYLSMGMTDDYELALEEGANMLRIGRAIFAG